MPAEEKGLLFLSVEDVLACGGADIQAAAQDVRRGFELLEAGRVQQPFKTTLRAPGPAHEQAAGIVNVLPACVHGDDGDVFSCKVLGAMPSNVAAGLPRASGLLLLFDPATKSPLCVMDAMVISATRTGAVSCLAAQRLVPQDLEEVALVGAGVNMRTQLLGLHEALPALARVRVYSRGRAKHDFALEMGRRTGLEITPCESAEQAVRGCELVVTCLPNVGQPVVQSSWVAQKGVTVFNIGCYESEATLLCRMDRIVADLWQQGKHRGVQTHAVAVAQGLVAEEKVEDLGPILTGRRPGRCSRAENIFFAPTGLGFEDAVVARRVFERALRTGVGSPLTLWRSPKWI